MRFTHRMQAVIFCFVVLVLIIACFLNRRDINDEWILDGIFPIYLPFVMLFAVIVSFSSNIKFIAIITSISLATFVLIPSLKYVFIYGYHDPLGHYGFIRELINSGSIPESGFYASQYGSTPGSHIIVSTISLIAGLDAAAAMKVFLIISAFIIPLATYFVIKKLNMPKKLFKIIIIATAVTAPVQYIFTGTIASYPILVLFFCFWLLLACRDYTHSNFLIATLLGITIIISHDVTSFFVLACLSFVLFANLFTKTVKYSKYSKTNSLLNLTIVLLILIHFVFASSFNFPRLLFLIKDSIWSLFLRGSPVAFEYYQSFFELNLLQKVSVLAVRFAKNAILIFLSILAPLAIWRLKLDNNDLKRFYSKLAIPTVFALLLFILPLFVRPLVSRGLIYLSAFSPFLAGITIFWFIYSKRHFENTILAVIVFSLISISIIQIYPCQPLIPQVSTEYGNYYVADWREVSTIYTRSMIYFVATYNIRLNVWADDITRWEIYGLTSPTFQSLLTWHPSSSPLVLLSHAGDAHVIPSARDAVAHEQYLQNASRENSVIYNSGKSLILFNATIQTGT